MTNLAPKILLALMAGAAGAAAQEATSAPSPAASPSAAASPAAGEGTRDASSLVLAPRQADFVATAPADSDGVTRSVSPGIAAELAAGLPKFSPPTPTPTPAADVQDLRDVDKPKNEIKRLPKYIVRESRPPIFRVQDLATPSGRIDLSFKSHPGLNFGNILGLNSGIANEMYLDDLRQADIDELHDIAHAISLGGDRAEGSYILQQSRDAYMRTDDNSWNLGGPGYGAGNTGGGGK